MDPNIYRGVCLPIVAMHNFAGVVNLPTPTLSGIVLFGYVHRF